MKIKTALLITLFPCLTWAGWYGKVVGIADGDTLTVLNKNNHTVKIRLAEIDAPEKKQAYGAEAKASLSALCFGKKAYVNPKGTDKYKRTLARVRCDGIDANAHQVKTGMAWAYTQYLTDPEIARLQIKARLKSLGLWRAENPVAPWDYRRK